MELKGFDSYDVSLGDEMRGERASLGKSLEDVERDLRIKARMIVAIENCDLSGFANQSVIAGYVRSYARYLGMNAEDCYDRFCHASGYRSPAQLMSSQGDGSAFGSLSQPAVTSRVGSEIGSSRFAAPPTQTRFRARISMGALTSTMALIALICGLGYGGYALLQDIQRVGFAPSPDAPEVNAQAPEIDIPIIQPVAVTRPNAADYEGGGALALTTPAELPPIDKLRRDGPISAIDPDRTGLFAKQPPTATLANATETDVPPHVRKAAAERSDNAEIETADIPAISPAEIETGIIVHASQKAWIRVRDDNKATLWSGTLEPGQRYRLPDRIEGGDLRSGNAGGVFVYIDGVSYGPIGKSGQPRTVSISAEAVRASMPQAEPPNTDRADAAAIQASAEARLNEQ